MSWNPPLTGNVATASRVSVTPVPTQNSSQIGDEPEKTTKHYQNDEVVETSVKDYQIFITIMLTISIFGASTFAVIAGQMEDPAEIWKPKQPPFTLPTVRRFLAVAWLCFILTIAVAGYSSSLLTILRQQAQEADDKSWHRNWDKIGIVASVMMHLFLVLAFLFLSLGLVAYVGALGWVGVGFSTLAGAFVIGLSVFQCRHFDKPGTVHVEAKDCIRIFISSSFRYRTVPIHPHISTDWTIGRAGFRQKDVEESVISDRQAKPAGLGGSGNCRSPPRSSPDAILRRHRTETQLSFAIFKAAPKSIETTAEHAETHTRRSRDAIDGEITSEDGDRWRIAPDQPSPPSNHLIDDKCLLGLSFCEKMGGERKIKSVAIIGAGAAGAVTAAAFKAEDYFEKIRVYERRESAGGTWIYDPNPADLPPLQPGLLPPELDPALDIPAELPQVKPHSTSQERYTQTPIYHSLTTNVPDIAMSFSDSRFAYGPFAPHWIPRQYIENYFSQHKTDNILVLNTTVEDVTRIDALDRPEQWRLTLRRFDPARNVDVWWQEIFDAVVFANGHYSIPYVPQVKGLEEYIKKFPGRVVHSKTYRSPQPYAGKKIVVIGNSASGHDVTAELVGTAAEPVIQSRRSKSRWDGDEPPPGQAWKPVIREFQPDGRIVFEDDTYLDDVDHVIYCTGYKASYPFWNSKENNNRPLYDYKKGKLVKIFWHTFFQDFQTLGIVGMPRVLTFRSFEYQAIALARLFSGRNSVALPSLEEQERWEREREETVRREGRKFHDIPWETGETFEWLTGLYRVAGLPTLRGKGRVPPVLSEDLIWALEHLKKYPEPGNGDDEESGGRPHMNNSKPKQVDAYHHECLDGEARGQWSLPARPKKDLLSFI